MTTNIKSLPSACGPFDGNPLSEWLKSYRTVEALDFDVLAAGHGTGLFKKADVATTREFFEDLIAAVSAGIRQGKSLEEMEKTDPAREVQGLGAVRPAARLQHPLGVPEPEDVSLAGN